MWDNYLIKLFFFVIAPFFGCIYSSFNKFKILNKRYLIYCLMALTIINVFSFYSLIFLVLYFYLNTVLLNKKMIKFGLLLNFVIVLFIGNFNTILESIEMKLNTSLEVICLVRLPVVVLGFILIGQCLQFFKKQQVKTIDYIGLSLFSVVFPMLSIVKFEKIHQLLLISEKGLVLKKYLFTSVKLMIFALVFRLLVLVPCSVIVDYGIHSEFSLNFVQAWFCVFSNAILMIGELLFSSIIAISLINIYTGVISDYSFDLKNNDFLDFSFSTLLGSPKLKNTVLSSVLFFALCIAIGLGVFQAVTGSFFFFITLFFFKKKRFIRKLGYFPMLFFLLSLSVFNFHEFKFVIQGMLSIHTLFLYFNELYLIYAIGGEFYISSFVILIGVVVLCSFNRFIRFCLLETSLDYIYILIFPFLILFQL